MGWVGIGVHFKLILEYQGRCTYDRTVPEAQDILAKFESTNAKAEFRGFYPQQTAQEK